MRTLAALLPALLGGLLLAIAAAQGPAARPAAADPALPHRILAPALAADSAAGAPSPATPTPSPTAALPQCGYRALVRNLADPDAASVDRTPASASIGGLLALDRPAGLTAASPRIAGDETRAVALTAWLRGAIRTSTNDIELLISTSPDGPLLRARLAGPECAAGASEADRAAMEAARIAFISACGLPTASQWRPLGGQAALTGIPAWGQPRSSGVDGAPSGIELAPVLAFAMPPGADCDPAQPFGPTPTPTPGPDLELLINLSRYKSVTRGTTITVTIIVQEPPPPGGSPRPGPAGIQCSYTAFDRAGQPIAAGGPAPTGPGGTVTFQFTIPEWAATGSPSEPGSVVPACDGLATRGGARLEIVP